MTLNYNSGSSLLSGACPGRVGSTEVMHDCTFGRAVTDGKDVRIMRYSAPLSLYSCCVRTKE